MTTEHAMVYAKAFSSVPTMVKTFGNKSSSYVKLEQGVSKISKNGIEVVAEDLTTVKVGSSNNKNTVTTIEKNSKELVLYEDKNSKMIVDTKKVSTENNETIGSTNTSPQVNKGTTSNNQKVNVTTKTTEGKTKTTNTNSYVTGIKEDEPNTFLNGTKFKELEPKSGKVENLSELLTDEGIDKLKNMTTEEVANLFEKEGLNPKDFKDTSGTGNGQKFSIPNNKFMIPVDFEKGKRKMITVGSVRTNSGGSHGSSPYILFGTNDGKYKIVFGDPKDYKYNITNKENANIIFVNPKR